MCILIFANVLSGCSSNSSDRKLDKAYDILKKGEYLDYNRRIELDKLAKAGNKDAKALYGLDVFLEHNKNAVDVIYSEEVEAGINYRRIFEDADFYLMWDYVGKYQDFFNEIKSHVDVLRKKEPESVRFESEEEMYADKLPTEGMKTIYFDVCSLGVPSTAKVEADAIGNGSHMAYDWIVDGVQIFHANATNGYVYATYDYRYKLDEKKKENQNNSSGSSGDKKNTYYYHDSYDDGYNAIYDEEDYDIDRYNSDSDYANGVDDAMEDAYEDFGDDW